MMPLSPSIRNSLRTLDRAFAALYAALNSAPIARRILVALLAVHTSLLAYSAYVHSPTLNEPGHLVAGLSYWKFGRFDLYRNNPPLVRLVAALPVMAAGYKEDWSGFYDAPGAMPIFGMGEDFVEANGERTFFLTMIARWACIPFSWIGAAVCFLWARDLYGRPAGVLAATIWCFEPNILAHASLITSDAAGTALGLAACYTFWRWLLRPTWTQAALTGVVLGLAELAKTTLVVFYPLWPALWLLYRWPGSGTFFARKQVNQYVGGVSDADFARHQMAKKVPDPLARGRMTARDWLREAGMLALRLAVGIYVLNLGYGFEGSFTRLNDFHFVSDLFTGNPPPAQRPNNPPPSQGGARGGSSPQPLAPSPPSINRFANTWLGHLPVPFPKHYLLGIDIQQKDFEDRGRPFYLRGEWRDVGWWYYYLYAAAIKVPLALWTLGLLAVAFRVFRNRFAPSPQSPVPPGQSSATKIPLPPGDCSATKFPLPRREGLGEGSLSHFPAPRLRDELLLLFPGLLIFALVSSKTGFNEHFRYALPSFPYFFIFISQVAQLAKKRSYHGLSAQR
jgi:hypothetical protein